MPWVSLITASPYFDAGSAPQNLKIPTVLYGIRWKGSFANTSTVASEIDYVKPIRIRYEFKYQFRGNRTGS